MVERALLALLLATASALAHANGPSSVAISDRAIWPRPLNSPESFDTASRAEILAFGNALADSEQMSDADMQARLRTKSFDHASVERVRAKYWQRLTAGYLAASAHCANGAAFCMKVDNQADFVKAARTFSVGLDSEYRNWFVHAGAFHRTYLNELLRLAALFPRVSSEVDTYSSREIDGSALPDRTFLLTFDDGPSAPGSTTDQLVQTLRASHLSGTFFTLGPQLQSRLQHSGSSAIADTYRGMCVGAHGWQHRSHATWADWEDSVTRSIGLVRANVPPSFVPLFRPPYGERRADSGSFFDSHGLYVTLWNIDSQDWNEKVNADQVKQRVLTLTLLWRRGIILFHDIHPKAQVAVPWLHDQLNASGIQWMDCKALIP
ncbi:polysaccharide deacetylase family protein [Caballeronia sp. M1242]|uniref:polysaccharide deacetylase family protein n=1 Tax=Caballeronia sp. M1242 TaxID=2814653 RepID=UPI0019D2DAED|nr:polysaccharide deacetylase family protein [Caballeronia sp. M1242]QSN63519.1 polysaccharide deacetylase family protein [Caballeronia sp. M1242]